MVFFFNDTQAIIGKNVQIILTGDALVEAVNKIKCPNHCRFTFCQPVQRRSRPDIKLPV